MDLHSLGILFSHNRPRDDSLENISHEISRSARALWTHKLWEDKRKIPLKISRSLFWENKTNKLKRSLTRLRLLRLVNRQKVTWFFVSSTAGQEAFSTNFFTACRFPFSAAKWSGVILNWKRSCIVIHLSFPAGDKFWTQKRTRLTSFLAVKKGHGNEVGHQCRDFEFTTEENLAIKIWNSQSQQNLFQPCAPITHLVILHPRLFHR